MAQHDMVLDNLAGTAFRANLNAALLALVTASSGASAPTLTYAYQWWADAATGILKQRNAANTAWISILTLATGKPVGGVVGVDVQAYSAALSAIASGASTPLTGTSTNDNAAGGKIGEYIESYVTPGTGIANAETNSPGSVFLTPGDWDVDGIITLDGTSATISRVAVDVGTTAGKLGDAVVSHQSNVTFSSGASGSWGIAAATKRISIGPGPGATTYISVNVYFGAGTVGIASAFIRARRVR